MCICVAALRVCLHGNLLLTRMSPRLQRYHFVGWMLSSLGHGDRALFLDGQGESFALTLLKNDTRLHAALHTALATQDALPALLCHPPHTMKESARP